MAAIGVPKKVALVLEDDKRHEKWKVEALAETKTSRFLCPHSIAKETIVNGKRMLAKE